MNALPLQSLTSMNLPPLAPVMSGQIPRLLSTCDACDKLFNAGLQALQYLRKLCSHPLLVLDGSVPQHAAAVAASGLTAGPADWGITSSPLRSLHHAPKLQALAELLQVHTGLALSAYVTLGS